MESKNALFSERDLATHLEKKIQKMLKAIEDAGANTILSSHPDELVEAFSGQASANAPNLLEDQISFEPNETKIDVSRRNEYDIYDRSQPHYVPGTQARFFVPFEGDKDLFRYMPSQYGLAFPHADITQRDVIITFQDVNLTADKARKSFESELASIKGYLQTVESDVVKHNARAKSEAARAIRDRKQRLLSNQNLAASIGYPLRERSDMPRTYVLPDIRRKIIPQVVATVEPFVPEPAIDEDAYGHILKVISNMVLVMEQSPSAFVSLDEEALRTHFLVQLNGHFEGRATGETFHGSGKTDILIQENGKCAFIAECKFWDGPSSITKAIDQILDYSIWRDARLALVVFNRNVDFSAVIEQMPSVIEVHPNTAGDVQILGETTFRSRLRLRDDSVRQATLTTMVFNVPTSRTVSDRLSARDN